MIRPDDPWYPCEQTVVVGECAFKMADAMIERANRDEGKG